MLNSCQTGKEPQNRLKKGIVPAVDVKKEISVRVITEGKHLEHNLLSVGWSL